MKQYSFIKIPFLKGLGTEGILESIRRDSDEFRRIGRYAVTDNTDLPESLRLNFDIDIVGSLYLHTVYKVKDRFDFDPEAMENQFQFIANQLGIENTFEHGAFWHQQEPGPELSVGDFRLRNPFEKSKYHSIMKGNPINIVNSLSFIGEDYKKRVSVEKPAPKLAKEYIKAYFP